MELRKKTFKDALNKAYENVEKNKLKAFNSILTKNGQWNDEIFIFEEYRVPQKVCKFSRDRLIDEDMTEIIKKEIGKDFFEDSYKGISYEAGLVLLLTKGITRGKLNIDKYKNIELLKGNYNVSSWRL